MDTYTLIKTLHILSATVLFGTGIGTAFQMWMAHRSGNVQAIAQVSRQVVLADWLFTTPAIVLQPATGIWLAATAGYDLLAPWLVATYALYLLAGACWLPVIVIQLRIRDLAGKAAAQNLPLEAPYAQLMRWWFLLGWPAFIGLVGVFWLMVRKPALWL